jgi:nicotinate-nucleotide adenylyltransferase
MIEQLITKPKFDIDTIECLKKPPSNTLETVVYFQNRFKNAKLYFLIGGDQLARIHE